MDKLLDQAGQILLAQGLPGLAILGLIFLILWLRADLKAERLAYRTELAEKDKLISDIQEKRVSEALAGTQAIRSMQATYDALIGALKGRR